MKKIFITYGDSGFESAKAKLIKSVISTGEFDEVYAYDRDDVSKDLLESKLMKISRGGGLWSWKPDILLATINKSDIGDVIVYCDAGCTVYKSKEWGRLWKCLENHDIVAQRIYQKTAHWTRREIVDYFSENGLSWLQQYQYSAGVVILKNTAFSKMVISEWRNLMLSHPEMVMDVTAEDFKFQLPGFVENRHDQSIYSALVYKYLHLDKYRSRIFTQWERYEDFDPIVKQAIRATRLRNGEEESSQSILFHGIKRLVKHYLIAPLYFIPRQWYVSNRYER